MNIGIAQGERNPNSSWLNSRGVWLTYVILVFVLHFILLSIPYINTPVAWTLTTTIHNVVRRTILLFDVQTHDYDRLRAFLLFSSSVSMVFSVAFIYSI
jgi:hypothetical protein